MVAVSKPIKVLLLVIFNIMFLFVFFDLIIYMLQDVVSSSIPLPTLASEPTLP